MDHREVCTLIDQGKEEEEDESEGILTGVLLLSFAYIEPSSVILLLQRVRPAPIPSGKVVYNGWLTKRGGTGMTPRNWRRRWFVVRDDCIAYYYHTPDVSVCAGHV